MGKVMFTLSGHSEFAVIVRVHTLTSHLAPFPFFSVFVRDMSEARDYNVDCRLYRLSPHQRSENRTVVGAVKNVCTQWDTRIYSVLKVRQRLNIS